MLYSKAHLAVRHAASTDETRYNLNGVRFCADGSTEATDGHMLMRVKAETPPAEEFPEVPGVERTDEKAEPFTLPLDAVNRLLKQIPKRSPMPVLTHALLDVAYTNTNGAARFVTTDLETHAVTEAKKVEADWPTTEQILEPARRDAKPIFAVNLRLLERLTKAAKDFTGAGSRDKLMARFHYSDEKSALRITVSHPARGELEALVMPMRDDR